MIVEAPPLPAATTPLHVVRVVAAAAAGRAVGATPAFSQSAAKSEGSVTTTHGWTVRVNAVRMRWR